jgi:hypothetical protein
MTVVLSKDQLILGAKMGAERRALSIHRDSKSYTKRVGWEFDIEGALAEIAASVALGVKDFIPSIDTFHTEADIPEYDCEVRQTKYDNGKLIVRPGDDPIKHRPYVLVTGEHGVYKIRGWMYGFEVMTEEHYVKEKDPYWWAAQQELRPLQSLIESRAVSGHEKRVSEAVRTRYREMKEAPPL